jgi:hypothetical protein
MALQEMFPAVANSPATELSAAITDIQTTITLLDASKLPDAPNIATIGVDESAETIKYTGKSVNTLTGVTRGFSGTVAKAWATGVGVARYFTAYDADALRENVTEHSAELVSVNERLSETAMTAPGKSGILYAGVIRNDGTGWKFISDSTHGNINFKTITTTPGHAIQVNFTASRLVGSFTVTPDDTLAGYGITCGASVGDSLALIYCYAPFTGYIDGSGLITGNPWFNGAYTVVPSGDGTGYTVNYDGGNSNPFEKVIVTTTRNSTAPHIGTEIRTARRSSSSVELRAYSDLYGYVYYDGASWKISSSCVANLSASFFDGVLTITHDGMSDTSGEFEYQKVSTELREQLNGSLIHRRISQVSQTQIKVKFYNSTGTLLTTPTTDMRLFFNRPGFKVPHIWNVGAKAFFDFGHALVRPDKLESINGNLWLLGLHQSN